MQALILAAGMGTRLAQYTDKVPKCMVPVNGKPLIESSVEALIAAGIKKLVIGLGYKGDVLRKYMADTFTPERLNGMTIEYVENSAYETTNNIYSLFLASSLFARDDTILLESDLIYDASIITSLLNSKEPNIAVVSPFESWMDGTCTALDENNAITALIDKKHFDWDETNTYYKTVNIYKFSKEFITRYYLPFLDSYQKVYGTNEYYETVLSVISFLTPGLLKGLPVTGDSWYEIDDPADLNIAENRFAPPEKKMAMMQERAGGSWRFPGLADFTNTANPFFPPPRLIDELKANLAAYITGKPSSHKQLSILAGKLFRLDPSLVLTGNGAAALVQDHKLPFFEKGGTFITNPGTIDGTFLPEKTIIEMCGSAAASGEKIYVNETYRVFSDTDIQYTLLTEKTLRMNPNLVVTVSLSDMFGVPGLDLALIACGDASYIAELGSVAPEGNIATPSEYFLQILEKYKKDYTASFAAVAAERRRVETLLEQIPGFTVRHSQSNSILIFVPEGISAIKVAQTLLSDHKMFVMTHNDRTIRIAVRTPELNTALIGALRMVTDLYRTDHL